MAIFLIFAALPHSGIKKKHFICTLSWNKDGWGDTTRAPIVVMIFLCIIKNEKVMRSHWKMLKVALVKSSSTKIRYNRQSPI